MAVVYFLVVLAISSLSLFGEAWAILSMLLTLVVIYLVGYFKGTGFAEIGLNRPESWIKTIWLGFVYAIVIFLLFRITLEPLLENVTGTERDLSRFDFLKGNLPALLQTLLLLWITAGFIEEVLFRGFLVTNIASMLSYKRAGWILGVVVSSAIFALAHGYQGLSGILLTGSAGAFFVLIFLLNRKNLWVAIFAHGFTDSSGAIMVYLDVYDQVTSWLF